MTAPAEELGIPDPTTLVRRAVEALEVQFFEPLAVADLFRDAWDGATAALPGAGVEAVPQAPVFPTDPSAAYALHGDAFPALERLAAERAGTGRSGQRRCR